MKKPTSFRMMSIGFGLLLVGAAILPTGCSKSATAVANNEAPKPATAIAPAHGVMRAGARSHHGASRL